MSDNTVMIVGLGNPGDKYEQTRHNAGFIALDHFARGQGVEVRTEKMQGLFCQARIAGKKVLLLKPMTYMNRSGDCVLAFAKYFDISIENILVLHDDLDIGGGRIKIVSGGGAGGHNGIRSVISQLGTKDFARLKIGIGHPRDKEGTEAIPVERYVLSRFTQEQWNVFQDNLEQVIEGINLFVASGISSAMNTVNSATKNVT